MSVRRSKVSPSPSCPFETRRSIGYQGKRAMAPKEIEETFGKKRIGQGWGIRERKGWWSENDDREIEGKREKVWGKKEALPTMSTRSY